MSSSLLIILLVVVWLFVLAPMLIRSRNPIRRTGEALAQTRTLYSGGSGRLVPSRGPAAVDPVQAEAEDGVGGEEAIVKVINSTISRMIISFTEEEGDVEDMTQQLRDQSQ